jgi:phosphoribosylamine-glycine ligase
MGMVDPDGKPSTGGMGATSVALPYCANTTPMQMILIIIGDLQQNYEIAVCVRVNVPCRG